MRKLLAILIVAVLVTSCGTSQKTSADNGKNAAKEQISVPEGMVFEHHDDFKKFQSIELPISGNGLKSTTTEGYRLQYYGSDVNFWYSLYGFKGDLDEQIKKLKKTGLVHIKKPEDFHTTKMKIGDYNVVKIEYLNMFESGSGYGSIAYGYLVQHGDEASAFLVGDGYITPGTDIEAYKNNLEEVFLYMIKTVKI